MHMTDHKFTDDDVIKALECCSKDVPIRNSCEGCPFAGKKCAAFLPQTALDLINRQKAEIERLESIRADLSKDIERLKDKYECIYQTKAMIKAEAIKEFAERLKAKEAIHFCKCGQPFVYTDLFNGEIDNIVQEMTEVKK